MAKRMKFSVVGLPHYTIWHLYEPSVDDIRHMEEMEKERKAKEAEEAAKKERLDKIKDQFDSKSSDWEKEKAEVQNLVQKAKNEEKEQGAEAKEGTKKNEAAKEEAKKSDEPLKEARDFQQPGEIHEVRGSEEKKKVEPKQ
jgi:mannan polymerase II complex ANP1 subunit